MTTWIERGLSRLRCRAAIDDDSGAVTVEFVIWFTTFFFVVGMMVDASMVLLGRTQALQVLQDANRARAVGDLGSDADAQAYISATLAPIMGAPQAVSVSTLQGVLTSQVMISTDNLDLFGVLHTATGGFTMVIGAQQLIENLDG